MSPIEEFLTTLGDEIQDAYEETFDLFSHSPSSQDLGMVDPRAEEIDVSIDGRDFTIKQSPGALQSKREGGTTGAAVWRTSIRLAEWFAWPSNPLFNHSVLDPYTIVLELGSGISGIVASILSTKVSRMIATDQQYVLKLLRENVEANAISIKSKFTTKAKHGLSPSNIDVVTLDWETDDTPSFLRTQGLSGGVDAVVVCDCIFNYALIEPVVQTCLDIAKIRRRGGTEDWRGTTKPTLCIIAQQLRQSDVFEQWLNSMLQGCRVWRIPDSMLNETMKERSGYVIHVAILR